VTSYCASSCYQPSVILLPTVVTPFNRTVRRARATVELLRREMPDFIAAVASQQLAQTLILWITESGQCYRSGSISSLRAMSTS